MSNEPEKPLKLEPIFPVWKEVIAPTARGLEAFFWRLVFVAVVVAILCSYNPFRQGDTHEDRTSSAHAGQALRQESTAQR